MRRSAVQPVQFVCLRSIGPLMMVITAPATRVSLPDTIGGCVGVLHCLVFGVSVRGTSSKGFVRLSLRSSSLLSSSFDVVVMKELILTLPSEPSNFCRNHFHFEVPMEVSVPDVSRCINCVPEYFVLKSLYYSYVARFCASTSL